jgi:Trypsin-like peptidase domain
MKNLIFILILLFMTESNGQVNSLSEELIHSTIRIECQYSLKDSNGKIISTNGTGSGFIFSFKLNESDSTTIPVIVTNKHVIQNAIKGKFLFTKKDSIGNPIYGEKETIEVNNFQQYWLAHPDPSVDLCIMPIAPILNQSIKNNKPIYYKNFDENLIPKKEVWDSFTALEDILMIGYPIGLWDSKNNIPIIRKGQTATPMKIDYQGKSEFLIDIPAFPGSSGSPIILYNQGSYATDTGISLGTRLYLVGILYAGPIYNAKGTGEITIHNLPINITTSTGVPINIGVSIKSYLLLDFKKELKKLLKN